MNENTPAATVRLASKKRTAPQVSATLSKDATEFADSLVPQSCHETAEALRRRDSGVHHRTQYLPVTVRAILRNVLRGMNRGTAAELCGVRASQLYSWVSEHPDLADALARAEAHVEHELIEVVRGGFSKNARLALELLERRFPRNWAQQSRHEHNGFVAHGMMGPDFLSRLAEARARRDAANAAMPVTSRANLIGEGQN